MCLFIFPFTVYRIVTEIECKFRKKKEYLYPQAYFSISFLEIEMIAEEYPFYVLLCFNWLNCIR